MKGYQNESHSYLCGSFSNLWDDRTQIIKICKNFVRRPIKEVPLSSGNQPVVTIFHSGCASMNLDSCHFDSTSFKWVSEIWQCVMILCPLAELNSSAHCLHYGLNCDSLKLVGSGLFFCDCKSTGYIAIRPVKRAVQYCAPIFVGCSVLMSVDLAVPYHAPMVVVVHFQCMVPWLGILAWPLMTMGITCKSWKNLLGNFKPSDTPSNFAWRPGQIYTWTELLGIKIRENLNCDCVVIVTLWTPCGGHELIFLATSGLKKDFGVILAIGANFYVHYTYDIYVMYSV